jgi:hypothetical protein
MLPTVLAVAHAALKARWIVVLVAAAVWFLRELVIRFFSNSR